MPKPTYTAVHLFIPSFRWITAIPQLLGSLLGFAWGYFYYVIYQANIKPIVVPTTPENTSATAAVTSTKISPGILTLTVVSCCLMGLTLGHFFTFQPSLAPGIRTQLETLPLKKIPQINLDGAAVATISGQNYQATITQLAHILELQPQHFPTLINLGLIYYQLDDLETAQKYFNQAREIDPNSPVFHN